MHSWTLSTLIHENQKGFIPGRYVSENIRFDPFNQKRKTQACSFDWFWKSFRLSLALVS